MIVASTGIIASILYAIYGKFKLTRNGCLWFNIAPLTAFHMSFVFVFFIGFDRLLAVLFPIWYFLSFIPLIVKNELYIHIRSKVSQEGLVLGTGTQIGLASFI